MYAYGNKLSPSVGGGLGGLPIRKATGSGVFESKSVSSCQNAAAVYDLIYKAIDSDSKYAFSPTQAPRGISPVSLTGNWYAVGSGISQTATPPASADKSHPIVYLNDTDFYVNKTLFRITGDQISQTSVLNVGNVGFTADNVLVISSTQFIAYQLVQTTVSSKMVLTINLRLMNIDGSTAGGIVSKQVVYTSVNIEASISSYVGNFRLQKSSSGKLIGVFYIMTYTTSNIYKNGFLHIAFPSSFAIDADVTMTLTLSGYNSSYALDSTYGSMYAEHLIDLGEEDYYYAIKLENTGSPNYYAIPEVYIFKDGVHQTTYTLSNLTAGYPNFYVAGTSNYFGSISSIKKTSTGYILYLVGGGKNSITYNADKVLKYTTTITSGTGSLGVGTDIVSPLDGSYSSSVMSSSNFFLSKRANGEITYQVRFDSKDSQSNQIYAQSFLQVGVVDVFSGVGTILEKIVPISSTAFNYNTCYSVVANPSDNFVYSIKKDYSKHTTLPTSQKYEKYQSGSYVLDGVALTSGSAGNPIEILNRGVIKDASIYGSINIDFFNAGGKLLVGASNDAIIY